MRKTGKSNAFALVALVLLVVCFTFPSVLFYKVPEKIAQDKPVSNFICSVWNVYQTGRYVSPYAPAGNAKNLRVLIDKKAEIGMMSFPIWSVKLEAPNYPKASFPEGIPIYFHVDGYSGDVHEMDVINHYIGMYPMEAGATYERAAAPFLLLGMTLLLLVFIVAKRSRWARWLTVPGMIFPFAFFAIYARWLYWYGHHLQAWGMFKVKPFMPTALGDGRVAQYTTHSYPTIGFYILLIIAILCLLAFMARGKELSKTE
jgi:hypothetical protein